MLFAKLLFSLQHTKQYPISIVFHHLVSSSIGQLHYYHSAYFPYWLWVLSPNIPHPERVNQIASTIYTLSANSFLQSLFDRDSHTLSFFSSILAVVSTKAM